MWQPSASVAMLQKRAQVLAAVRAHFAAYHVLEVQTPLLSTAASTDVQLESLKVTASGRDYYLLTSPELPIKRLLAAGVGDCYQIGSVFRDGECGARHNIEFTLIEWYRLDIGSGELARQVCDLIMILAREFADNPPREIIHQSYRQVFLEYLAVDILNPAHDAAFLNQRLRELSLRDANQDDLAPNEALDLLFALGIAPQFAPDALYIIDEYPQDQAVLAKLNPQDPRFAQRFEIYWGALELANGFAELQDAKEQRARFVADNQARVLAGKKPMPLDERFLAALDAGLPECAGVALGLDRLLMRLFGLAHIKQTLAFAMDNI